MRRPIRSVLTAAAASPLLLSCGGDDLAGAEREWAERATLEIARTNDVVALELLPALLGKDELDAVETVEGEQTPNWPALDNACSDLEALIPEIRQVATDAPSRFARAGDNLVVYAEKLEHFAGECDRAVGSEDFHTLEVVNNDLVEAGSLVEDIGGDLPDDIGCPDDVVDRPETCDT